MGCLGIGASLAFDAAGNSMEFAKLMRNKNEQQKKVIKYFLKTGCFSFNMSDDEYLSMVTAKRDSLNFRKRALDKIGLDESQVSEISPVMFEGFVYSKAYSKDIGENRWVSSRYQISWLFFSSTQVYLYRYTFNMDDDGKSESTDEFFYKDITSFSTSSDTEETVTNEGKRTVETNKFFMVVPGDKFYCEMNGNSDTEAVIQGMKQKLREKKM